MLLNLRLDRVSAALQLDQNIEIIHILHQMAGAKILFQQLLGVLDVLLGHPLQHSQLLVRVAAHDAQHRRNVHPPESAGVGHHHALYVLNNVAAAIDLTALRHFPQQAAGLGGGVGNGDRLRTAQGHQQLVLQNRQVVLVQFRFHHYKILLPMVSDCVL